jgi:hypothetical protein
MTEPKTAQSHSQFIVLTYNEHDRIDAAPAFRAKPEDAYSVAAKMATMSGSLKFQVYAVLNDGNTLSFGRV